MKIKRAYRGLLGLLCLFALGSCENHPNVAFPTAGSISAHSSGGRSELVTLERGRKIYTTSCTECHVARNIADYSVPQWRHYVDIMAPRAGLPPSDRAALEAYVIGARESVAQNSASNVP